MRRCNRSAKDKFTIEHSPGPKESIQMSRARAIKTDPGNLFRHHSVRRGNGKHDNIWNRRFDGKREREFFRLRNRESMQLVSSVLVRALLSTRRYTVLSVWFMAECLVILESF